MSSDDILVLTPELSKIFLASKNDISQLQNIHPDFYNQLISNRFIVDEDEDEAAYIINCWKEEDKNPKSIKITINPTLQCNLSCWYCYENHANRHYMDSSVLEAIKRYISNICNNNPDSGLILSFFGGEPLLYFAKIVEPLVTFAQEASQKFNKRVGVAFTTNGTLLSDKICAFLKATGLTVSFQITLDGLRENHNKTRFFKSGLGSYDMIISNIKKAVSYGFGVNVRFNYTNSNYSDCSAILTEFLSIPESSRNLIDFSFHKVWQEESSDVMEASIQDAHNEYLKNGFAANVNDGISAGRCYADYAQNIVINYDGLVYKCTARDFTADNAEGRLLSDGTVEWNKTSQKREQLKFGDETCRACPIFPICHNGCSQDKLEQTADNGNCPRGFTDLELIAKSHATSILRKHLAQHNKPNY